jgi:hypothetical protein
MSFRDFTTKIHWEGGIEGALAYGLRPSDAPLELEEAWGRLADAYESWVDALEAWDSSMARVVDSRDE